MEDEQGENTVANIDTSCAVKTFPPPHRSGAAEECWTSPARLRHCSRINIFSRTNKPYISMIFYGFAVIHLNFFRA